MLVELEEESEEEEDDADPTHRTAAVEEVSKFSPLVHSGASICPFYEYSQAKRSQILKRRKQSLPCGLCLYPSWWCSTASLPMNAKCILEKRRRARVTVLEQEMENLDSEEALKRKEQEAEERKKQSHDLVAESLRRELAESASLPSIHTIAKATAYLPHYNRGKGRGATRCR